MDTHKTSYDVTAYWRRLKVNIVDERGVRIFSTFTADKRRESFHPSTLPMEPYYLWNMCFRIDLTNKINQKKSEPDLVDVVVAEVDADEPGCVLEQFHLDLLHSIPRQILIFYLVKISHYKLNRERRYNWCDIVTS